jgi:CRP-like cAMP-binding protein
MAANDQPEHAAKAPLPDGVAALARLAPFAGAAADLLAAVAHKARWRRLGPGEVAIDFGDASRDVFVVAEGAVRVIVRTPAGQEVIFGDLGAGELFGEMAAIDGVPRSASVTALHPTRLCQLDADSFLELALGSPPVGLRLLRSLVGRLRLQDARMLELALLPVRLRLVAELLRLSRPRGEGAGRAISPPPLQHVLAARIGARREAVSRELSALAREGLVGIGPRAIVLPEPDALHALVQAELHGPPAG